MGPIQQATNQVLQAGAAAATIGKHFVNQKKRDALSALETTEALSNEYKDVSKGLEKNKSDLNYKSEQKKTASVNLNNAVENSTEMSKYIAELESNPHPKRANGKFMSSKEKDSKLEELYEKSKLLSHDYDVAKASYDKLNKDYYTLLDQKQKLENRYEFLKQKKNLVRDIMPSKFRANLDKQFDSYGETGNVQGQIEGMLFQNKKK